MFVVAATLSLSMASASYADEYNGITFGDYPTWADIAFAPQGN